MIQEISGDLFDAKTDALAHGCNAAGRMGAGIAKEFKARYPDMFKDYKLRAQSGLLTPGKGYIFYNQNKPHIINLITQGYGPSNLLYLQESCEWLNSHYLDLNVNSVAMPRIASGLGGLPWDDVRRTLYEVFEYSDLEVEIWS